METKTLIFDFDGTIADSLPVIIKVYHELMPKKPELSKEQFQRYRSLPAKQVAQELGISWWKAPFMVRKGRSMMHKYIPEVLVFEDIPEVVKTLRSRGYRLQIVSSNSTDNVKQFLELHGMAECFSDVHGRAGIFSKVGTLKKIVRRFKLNASETYYIGDEVKDSVAAHAVGMPNVSVTWGFNSKESLMATSPTHTADKPSDLLTIFK